MLKSCCLLASNLLISATLFAQVVAPGEGPWRGVPIWVGAQFSTFNPDYGCGNNSAFACWSDHLDGISSYTFANHIYRTIGAEGEARLLNWGGPGIVFQTSYLAGPRMDFFHYKNVMLSPKLLLGKGQITLNHLYAGSGHYFVYAPGGVLDYRISRRIA